VKEAAAVVLQATDQAIGAEVGMHRPRIAVDAEINGATAQVIRVSRAAHLGVARRLRQVELTVTGPYAAATSPTMRRSVALRQAGEAAHRTARAATDGASLSDGCLSGPRLAT
jgi:hypothetical protein